MPTTYTRRSVTEFDLPAASAIVRAMEREIATGSPSSIDRLRTLYLRGRPGFVLRSAAWERDGALVALAAAGIVAGESPPEIAYTRFIIDPAGRTAELEDAILAWSCATARGFGPVRTLESSSSTRTAWRIAALERNGFVEDRRFAELTRPLLELPEAPPLPAGYRIRVLDPATELERWIALFNESFVDHYDFHPLPPEMRVSWMQESRWRPDLDLVVEAPDGELAAFGVAAANEHGDGGIEWHVDLIGTSPPHRRLGLARAVTTELLHRVRAAGGERATLEVDATSPTGADRLYEQLGFALEQMFVDYRLPMDGR